MTATSRLTTRPVTKANVADFEALFSSKGCPGYCWCAPYRFKDAHTMDRDAKRDAMLETVSAGTPIGILAYRGGTPIAWCSIAPRQTYAKLERSRTMPDAGEPDTWTILCLFIQRPERGTGVAAALVDGALRHAFTAGAAVVEAYPRDTAGITSTHYGHSALFAAAGFRREGATRRWVRRP